MMHPPRPQSFSLDGRLEAIGPAVAEVLAGCEPHLPPGADGVEVADCVALALTEVLSNCVKHAYAGREGGPIRIETEFPPGAVTLHVRDRGRPPPLALVQSARLPDPLSLPESGWGWALVHRLSDRVSFERRAGWNRLTLERRFWRYYDAESAWTAPG